jgi:hypothetical protein
MTVLYAIEQVEQLFPKVGRTQIIGELDKAQKEFVNDTKILTKRSALTSISTNTSWTLPTDCIEVLGVELYDSTGLEVYLDEVSLTYMISNGVITFYSTEDTLITGIPTSVTYIYLDYVYVPTSLTVETDTFTIPEDFHEAVLDRVLAKFYARFPQPVVTQNGSVITIDTRSIQYWNSEYNKKRIEGKKWFNIQKDQTHATIIKDFMGNPLTVRRSLPSSTGTVPVNNYGALYTKYYRFTATSPSTLTENETYGFTSPIVLSIAGGTITATSSAEFTTSMFIVPNQSINYLYISTSSIEFYPPTSWGTLVIEIYLR